MLDRYHYRIYTAHIYLERTRTQQLKINIPMYEALKMSKYEHDMMVWNESHTVTSPKHIVANICLALDVVAIHTRIT